MTAFRTVGVIGKRREPSIATLTAMCNTLTSLGCEVLIEENAAIASPLCGRFVTREELAARSQLAIVVGGDGTLLGAGRALAPAGVPILGINQGRLGFMVDVAPGVHMAETLAAVINGQYEIEERLLLQATLNCSQAYCGEPLTAVNDVVIRNLGFSRMIEFETWLDQEFISLHRADGVIVSSPTGSTAYALSGGGPLLHPSLDALALVPICPHTLSDRPIVVGADRAIRIVIRGDDRAQVVASLDGQNNQLLQPGDSVEVRRHPHRLKLIHPAGYSYFRILRNKLRWGRGPEASLERV